MSIDRRRFLTTGAAGAGALALLGACSSDGDDDAGSPGGTSASASGWSDQIPAAFTPILLSTVGAESAPVSCTDGKERVLYELVLTNSKPAPATIERIDVVDIDDHERVLATYEGPDLVTNLRRLSGAPANDANIEPDASRLLLIEVVFDDEDDVPAAVAQRFVGLAAASPGTDVPSPVDYLAAPFGLSDKVAATIGPPLRGGRWLAINGLDTADAVHRGSIQSVDGRLFDAQRFAIDWMLLDDDGTLSSGGTSAVESYHSYDQPVLAVADGTVVEVLDELADQAPGTLPDPSEITLDTVDGNHVILDLGDGVFAFYAHLKQGSIEVAEGDSVTAGQEIGRLGNSGNTSAPHLHLHLMTAPSALGADSIPYEFERFEVAGRVDDTAWMSTDGVAGPWEILAADEPTEHRDQLPLGLTAVVFPD